MAPWYEAVGFDPQHLQIDPMLRGPHRPLDNVGLIIAYLAGLVANRDREDVDAPEGDTVIVTFLIEHLDAWFERFCNLLGRSASPYLRVVAEALQEGVEATRVSCSDPIRRSVADDSSQAISMRTCA